MIYHRVNDAGHPFFPGVPTELFRVQMEVLAKHFNVLPLRELVARSATRDVPPRALAITFDDGYRDNYLQALPILERHGLPATVFLTTGAIHDGGNIWHDQVFNAFRLSTAESFEWGERRLPLHEQREKRAALAAVLADLWRCGSQARAAAIADLMQRLHVSAERLAVEEKLSWDEVREMARQGVTFGAHTVTHPILTSIPPHEAEGEIRRSKADIERQLGQAVTLFAYPNGRRGDFDEATKEVLRSAGFEAAVTTIWGSNSGRTDRMALHRVQTWDRDPLVSALRLAWEG